MPQKVGAAAVPGQQELSPVAQEYFAVPKEVAGFGFVGPAAPAVDVAGFS